MSLVNAKQVNELTVNAATTGYVDCSLTMSTVSSGSCTCTRVVSQAIALSTSSGGDITDTNLTLGCLINFINESKGKLKLVKLASSKNEEIIKEKLTKHFISLVGNNKELMNEYKTAMKLFNEEYNRNKLFDENIQELTKKTFLEKVKGLVKCK